MTLLNVVNTGRAISAALVVAVISVLVLQFSSTTSYKVFIVLTIPFCLLCSKQKRKQFDWKLKLHGAADVKNVTMVHLFIF